MNAEKLLDQEILASFERGEWRPAKNQKAELARLRAAAEATLLKNKRAAAREQDLADIKALEAVAERRSS